VYTLIEQLHFQLDLVGLPTIRETDGLARSSRNVYLNDAEREEAPLLHQFLNEGLKFIREGMTDAREVEAKVRSLLKNQMPHAEVEYVKILNYPSLEETTQINEQIILAAAIKYRQARLIDNVLILPNGTKQDKITLVNKIKVKAGVMMNNRSTWMNLKSIIIFIVLLAILAITTFILIVFVYFDHSRIDNKDEVIEFVKKSSEIKQITDID